MASTPRYLGTFQRNTLLHERRAPPLHRSLLTKPLRAALLPPSHKVLLGHVVVATVNLWLCDMHVVFFFLSVKTWLDACAQASPTCSPHTSTCKSHVNVSAWRYTPKTVVNCKHHDLAAVKKIEQMTEERCATTPQQIECLKNRRDVQQTLLSSTKGKCWQSCSAADKPALSERVH